jgi:hypothetical protein
MEDMGRYLENKEGEVAVGEQFLEVNKSITTIRSSMPPTPPDNGANGWWIFARMRAETPSFGYSSSKASAMTPTS